MEKGRLQSIKDLRGHDYYSIVSLMLTVVRGDQSQMRRLVYEFARRQLRRNLYPQFEDGEWDSIQEQMHAFETAIEKIETEYGEKSPTIEPQQPLAYGDEAGVASQEREGASRSLVLLDADSRTAADLAAYRVAGASAHLPEPAAEEARLALVPIGPRQYTKAWWSIQLAMAAVIGIGLYVVSNTQSTLRLMEPARDTAVGNGESSLRMTDPSQDAASTESMRWETSTKGDRQSPAEFQRPRSPGIPLPTEYGAFAVSDNRLVELEPLSMRVPDQRIAISPVISAPSRVHLPDGKLEFVLFRRDLKMAAPDRISVRVIAQVVRALTFGTSGKPKSSDIENEWVVRSNAYQMRVAPMPENQEMILIRPDPPDFIFPAGRYALILKDAAYDFMVDGPIVDAAHCLERTDAVNAPVYTECRAL